MKKCVSLLILIAAMAWQLQAQDSIYVIYPPVKDFTTTINLYDTVKSTLAGTIIDIRDSSILMSPLIAKKGNGMLMEDGIPYPYTLPAMLPLTEVFVTDIIKIEIRRPNSFLRGAKNGALIGLVSGVVLGALFGDISAGSIFYLPYEEMILKGGIGLGIAGGVIGGIGGLNHVEVPVYGSQNNFDLHNSRIEKYKYTPNEPSK